MWDCTDSQEVGLEAATLERVRNSSLVEWFCADNVTGLKSSTEAADSVIDPPFGWCQAAGSVGGALMRPEAAA